MKVVDSVITTISAAGAIGIKVSVLNVSIESKMSAFRLKTAFH